MRRDRGSRLPGLVHSHYRVEADAPSAGLTLLLAAPALLLARLASRDNSPGYHENGSGGSQPAGFLSGASNPD